MKIILFVLSLLLYSNASFGQKTSEELAQKAMLHYETHKDKDVFRAMKGLESALTNYLYFDLEKAKATLKIVTAMADTSEIDIVHAMAFSLSGNYEKTTGDLDKAIGLFRQAEIIFEQDNLLSNTPGEKDFNSRNIDYNIAHMKKEIGDGYRLKGEIDIAKGYFEEYLELAEKNKDDIAILTAYDYMGICSDLSGDYHSGIKYYTKAIDYGNRIDYKYNYTTYGNMAISYYYLGDRKKCLENHLIMADGAEAIGNKTHQANAYGNIRELLLELEDYEGFFEYGEKIEKVYIETDSKWYLARLYNTNADAYIELDSLDLAMNLIEKSSALSQENNFLDVACTALLLKGQIFHTKKNYKAAEKLLTESVEYGKANNLEDCEYSSLSLLGSNYLQQNKARKAISILSSTIDKYEADENMEAIFNNKKNISKAYANIGNYNKAYQLLSESNILNDTLNDISKVSEIARKESDYQYEKDKEIIDLENRKQQEILQAKASTNRAIAFGIGGLAMLGFWFLFNARRQNNIIAQKNEQLESLNHTKDQIFSIIGHDLKKPAISFRGISKKLKYLIEKDDKDLLLKFGDAVESNAIELNKLTDNLLNWALLQKEMVAINIEELSLKDLAQENISFFAQVAAEKNIVLESNIEVEHVRSDKHVLSTVLRNLLDNAIKYTPEGGNVIISAIEKEGHISLSIKDNGIGMSNEQISKLFILDKAKSTKGTQGEGGTGLGMHLVQQLVEKIDGTIEVVSQLGSGSAIKVHLPSSI